MCICCFFPADLALHWCWPEVLRSGIAIQRPDWRPSHHWCSFGHKEIQCGGQVRNNHSWWGTCQRWFMTMVFWVIWILLRLSILFIFVVVLKGDEYDDLMCMVFFVSDFRVQSEEDVAES